MLTKSCVQCGATITKAVTCSMKDWNEQVKYCSPKCYHLASRKPSEKLCRECGKAFKPKHWEGRAVFCSPECSSAHQRKPLPLCKVCGQRCAALGRQFCSRACKVKWFQQSEHMRGYLGEAVRETSQEFTYLAFWKKRANEIRKRDKVCRHCGKTPKENGRILDVHHIVAYAETHDNSPENLIALCTVCHKKADRAQGH